MDHTSPEDTEASLRVATQLGTTVVDNSKGAEAEPSSPTEAECGDSPERQIEEMAIEDACDIGWEGDTNFQTSCEAGLGVVPLPPPATYSEMPAPAASDSPNYNTDLENLFSTEHQGDSLGPATPGVCGLCNLGNTCFMNSGLQCLLNTAPMVQFMMKQVPDETTTTDSLATHFTNLFHKVWSGKLSKMKPKELHQALAAHHPQFKDYRQHDCQEFLALVLGSLHELLNTASSKSHVSDLSADPMTPHSTCEEEREGSGVRGAIHDVTDHDSSSQMALSIAGLRCETSSSSRSSESSISASHIRLRPLPEDVQPFKSFSAGSSVLWETMDSITEGTCVPDDLAMNVDDECPSGALLKDESSSGSSSGSNIISNLPLKKELKVVNLNQVAAAALNNMPAILRGYEDILKDAKTSNVNVLVTEQGANNEIVFDSDKFPKHEAPRRRDPLENPNLTEFHNFDGKTVSVKRIKETNKAHQKNESTKDFLDFDVTSELYNGHSKRFKLEESQEKEKNFRMEIERKLRDDSNLEMGEFSGAAALNCNTPINVDDDLEADKQWEKHLGHNQSVIVDSFQGQFKSTVVCSECGYVSSTYEPFMYLSVPLPRAMEHQVCVTFVPASCAPPTQFLLTLNKQDKVAKIKEHLRKVLKVNVSMNIELAEVLHHHIARILDENHYVRYMGTADPHRRIYAYEISEEVMCPADPLALEPLDLTPDPAAASSVASDCSSSVMRLNNVEPETSDRRDPTDTRPSTITNNLKSCAVECEEVEVEYGPSLEHAGEGDVTCAKESSEWKSCAICLEEVEKGLKNHKGCSCFLCDSCIENSVKHYNESEDSQLMECPVCCLVCPASSFTAADDVNSVKSSLRMLKVPVLFRLDTRTQEDKEEQKLFGHPHLIKVTNRLRGKELYDVVGRLVPYNSPYTLLFVDGQGYHCSRCMYTNHCKGCIISEEAEDITLQTGDNLAVRFESPVVEVPAVEHRSLLQLRSKEDLSLYDCLDSFSESETLDEHNPWYCPTCQRNQCATKTLSVWRYPDFLIVYLKRFVFHEYTSVKLDNKVSFPLTGLSLAPPSRIQQGIARPYNLYACVNHFGGASAGHYTAYAKNPQNGEWHLFNDETVTAQKPQEEDYSHAYVLFYQKQGSHFNLNLPNSLLGVKNEKPNIDQLILALDSSVEQDTWQENNCDLL